MATPLKANKKRRRGLTEKQKIGAAKAEKLIIPVGEVKDYLKMVVYARGKIGKTTFGASGAPDLKTLIIDFNEQGTISVKKRKNVFRYEVQYWQELDWIYWYLRAGKHNYDVVCLDTVTSMASICMKFALGDEAARDASRDPLVPDKRAWGKVGQLMQLRLIDFRNLPMHTIYMAHERVTESEDEETESTIIEVVPSLSPAPRETLIGAVHVIGRMYTREVEVINKKTKQSKKVRERRMLIGPDDKYISGVRVDADSDFKPPRVVRNPTLPYFIKNILPAVEKDTDG